MKSKRRNHSAQFKAKVAMSAAKGDKTTAELSKQFQVHPTQITKWKKQLTGIGNGDAATFSEIWGQLPGWCGPWCPPTSFKRYS